MTYMIELPHSKEECLKVLDETSEKARAMLPPVLLGLRLGPGHWLGHRGGE